MARPPHVTGNALESQWRNLSDGEGVLGEIRGMESRGDAGAPHGVAYSVTLHDRNNTRILGYDNAHAVKRKRKGFRARKTTWDHVHKMEIVTEYELTSAAQLIED